MIAKLATQKFFQSQIDFFSSTNNINNNVIKNEMNKETINDNNELFINESENNIDICDELDYAKISTFLLTNLNKRNSALLIQALRQVS